ncbi:MAG TPA: hypothetical protein VG778_11420, partial [Blastocatellia bacterium]|nr:hypothetical protein [Blastocatellia bacterium]
PEQKMVMAHELMHALQDQHFNLRRFENWPKGDSDAELAVRALIEGEAMLIMYQYAFEQEGVRFDVTKIPSLTERMLADAGADDASKYPVLANAPAVLRDGLQFPYVYGAGFVQEVLKSGSWKAVGDSYDKLPASSEQIMHPERFMQRDNPIKVDVASLDEILGSDWKRVDADVTGEFGYLIALREFIGKSAAKAAAGWGGDGYLLFEQKKTRSTLLVQYTAWDNIAEAREFFDAYGLRTEKRYNQTVADVSQASSRVYETTEGIASIEIRGADVVIIEGAEDRKQLARIAERLWKSKKTERARVNLPVTPSGNAN